MNTNLRKRKAFVLMMLAACPVWAARDLVIDPARWQLSRKELTLTFNPYEVAPYAAGASSVSLPSSTLMPWLTAQFNDLSR